MKTNVKYSVQIHIFIPEKVISVFEYLALSADSELWIFNTTQAGQQHLKSITILKFVSINIERYYKIVITFVEKCHYVPPLC